MILSKKTILALAAALAPAFANSLVVTGTVSCTGYTVDVMASDLLGAGTTYAVNYTITLTPLVGTALTFGGSLSDPTPANSYFNNSTTQSYTIPSGTYSVTGAATLTANGSVDVSVPIAFATTTLTCGTGPGGGGGTGCPATIGYWKHHAFPAAVQSSGLTIGGVSYSASDLLTILNANGGNAVVILGRQLVGALLNQAAGGVDNPAADAAIASSEALLIANSLNLLTSNVAPSSTLGQALTTQATILNNYNNANFNTCSEGVGLHP